MSRNAWLTPNASDLTGADNCRALSVPLFLWRYVMGALWQLTEAENWEQDGDMTPEDITAVFFDSIEGMGDCYMLGEVRFFVLEPGDGWMVCDGSYIEEPTPLWYVMPHAPDANGRKWLPDLLDRLVMGTDDAPYSGSVGGSQNVTLSISNLPAHSHNVTGTIACSEDIGSRDFPSDSIPAVVDLHNQYASPLAGNYNMASGIVSGTAQSVGGGQSFSVLPPFCRLYPCIYVGV